MNAPERKKPMTVDEFIPWAMTQPKGRFELVNGEVVAMSPERVGRTRTKGLVFVALRNAIARAGCSCEAIPDGATVRIDEHTAYEPDAMVYCGPKLSRDSVEVASPVIVVEVVSPSSRSTDAGAKFQGYFSLPSVAQYLIVDPERRAIVHHRRGGDGQIVSAALTSGTLVLDPPRIEVAVADMLPAAE
jgi:Uma2 family endonuclease